MHIWIVVVSPTLDAQIDGIEREIFVEAYKSLDRAKEECAIHLRETFEDDFPEIKWEKTGMGWRGDAESIDCFYEIYEMEVV